MEAFSRLRLESLVGNALIYCRNALQGLPGEGQYDAIFVSGRTREYTALKFLERLKIGGRLVVPIMNNNTAGENVRGGSCMLTVYVKEENGIRIIEPKAPDVHFTTLKSD